MYRLTMRSTNKQQTAYIQARSRGLTPRQAAAEAGYKPRTAYALESKRHVKASIAQTIASEVNLDWVIARLSQAAIVPPTSRQLKALRMLYLAVRQRDKGKH